MNVFEYFDYEKQLLEDYQSVKTPHARTAVFKALVDTLDTHKRFVFNTISNFEENLKKARADLYKVQNGETPEFVKNMMAEFGFYEPEDAGYESTSDYVASTADVNRTIDSWKKPEKKPEKKLDKKRRPNKKKSGAEAKPETEQA